MTFALPVGGCHVVEVGNECSNEDFEIVLRDLRAGWNLHVGTSLLSKMPDSILQLLDGGDRFKRNFIIYMVPMFFHGREQNHSSIMVLKNNQS